MRWTDIRAIAVICGPGEVRYGLAPNGELQIYIGAGLDNAPPNAGHARVEEGFTTFVIQPSDDDDEPEAGIAQ
jgi:hypothetical protein